jgi:hypothetical protein
MGVAISTDEEIQEVYLEDIAKKSSQVRARLGILGLNEDWVDACDGWEMVENWTNTRWKPGTSLHGLDKYIGRA